MSKSISLPMSHALAYLMGKLMSYLFMQDESNNAGYVGGENNAGYTG